MTDTSIEELQRLISESNSLNDKLLTSSTKFPVTYVVMVVTTILIFLGIYIMKPRWVMSPCEDDDKLVFNKKKYAVLTVGITLIFNSVVYWFAKQSKYI